jgi:hypothetical protein
LQASPTPVLFAIRCDPLAARLALKMCEPASALRPTILMFNYALGFGAAASSLNHYLAYRTY